MPLTLGIASCSFGDDLDGLFSTRPLSANPFYTTSEAEHILSTGAYSPLSQAVHLETLNFPLARLRLFEAWFRCKVRGPSLVSAGMVVVVVVVVRPEHCVTTVTTLVLTFRHKSTETHWAH